MAKISTPLKKPPGLRGRYILICSELDDGGGGGVDNAEFNVERSDGDNVALTFTLLTRSTLFRLQFNILLRRRTLLPRNRF